MGSNTQSVYTPEHFERLRKQMVERQLSTRDIADERVLGAMGSVPREAFVNEGDFAQAYEDHPLPIGEGQTISQPYIVAKATQSLELEPWHRVLEIGSGSGYQAAILALLAREVVGIEFQSELAAHSRQRLARLGLTNIVIETGDGKQGMIERAPFDRILVSCSAREIEPAWQRQLSPAGILVVPLVVNSGGEQILFQLRYQGEGKWTRTALCPVRYVPLV